MKLTKLASIVVLSGALTLLIVGAVSAAPAAVQSVAVSNGVTRTALSATADLTDTNDLSGTQVMTHPVALKISLFFSASTTYSDVIGLHTEGFGFGEIARAYFIAKLSGGSVTPQQVLDLKAGGLGWGEIMKQYAFKPGKGNNLGSIMRSHQPLPNQNADRGGKPTCPGHSCNTNGKNKKH